MLGCIFLNDCTIQPQITSDLIISTNHLYAFAFISIIGFYTFTKSNHIKYLMLYLIFLSIILEILHLIIPERSFQSVDLLGNLLGVIIVIFIYSLINKYGVFKK